ncbi:MAG: prolyl oligopeptidase family serine peptidase, partial [Chloroflexi bacterium]|nr:prolyl oligopeptidase family serine peptidase [Chloroflexota bacterium]
MARQTPYQRCRLFHDIQNNHENLYDKRIDMITTNAAEPIWKQRFRAPNIHFVDVAANNPTRGLVATILSGIIQLHAWDTVDGSLHQVTFAATGKPFGALSPDGNYIYYLQDEMGNELGHFVRVPFAGGAAEDITPDLPLYTAFEIAFSHNGQKAVFIKAASDGFEVCVVSLDENQQIIDVRAIYHSKKMLLKPVVSSDGRFVAFQSTERSGKLQFNLVVIDSKTNDIVHDLWDGEDSSLQVYAFSPSDARLQLSGSTNVSGQTQPFLLDIESGRRTELALKEIEGDVQPVCWSPSGKRLLLCQIYKAEQRIYTYNLEHETLTRLNHPTGSFPLYGTGPKFVTEDEIYSGWQDAVHPGHVVVFDGWTGEFKRVALNAGKLLPSTPWKSVSYPSADQMPVQAWMAVPPGDGPFPTIIDIHGGPSEVTLNHFDPAIQAWLDHGFATISINYHGSITFGREFQDKIIGNLGHWELKDLEATYHWLVTEGIADPDKVFITGWSYGGYLTLLSLGCLPDYWA